MTTATQQDYTYVLQILNEQRILSVVAILPWQSIIVKLHESTANGITLKSRGARRAVTP